MKRVLFWILFAAAYYLAAMYRSQPLMAFCLGMLLLAMASFVQSRLLRKGLSVTFPHINQIGRASCREKVYREV